MANTIAGVNLAAIAEESLPALQSCFGPLRELVTDFSSDVQNAGESVTTRFPTKPTAQDLSAGYSATDVAMTARTVTLNTFFGFVVGFTDAERSKSSIQLNDLFLNPALDALGTKVFGDIWDLITAANFATNIVSTEANMDREVLIDAAKTLTDTKKAPKMGRAAWLNPGHYAAILKTLNSAEFPGQNEMKAEGIAPRVAKMNVHETDLADANAENLAGAAFHRSSLLFAGRRVDAEGAMARGVEVADVEVPGLGMPVQFRRWYDPDGGVLKYSVGLLYGVAKGTDTLVRITTV